MKSLKILFSNIRKRKGSAFTFIVLILISSLMLSISLSLMITGSSFYKTKSEELLSPHYRLDIMQPAYQKHFKEYMEQYEGITDMAVLNGLLASGMLQNDSHSLKATLIQHNLDEVYQDSFFKPVIIDEQERKSPNSIILPLSMKINGFHAGEEIRIECYDTTYQYVIYGFYEDAVMGAGTNGGVVSYVFDEKYQETKEDGVFQALKVILARFTDEKLSDRFQMDFQEYTKIESAAILSRLTYTDMESTEMMFVNIMSAIFLAFSIIILIIAFIVLGFSISTGISEDITVIGSLLSIGCKSRMLKRIQNLQYFLLTLIGSLIGSMASLLAFSLIGNIIAGVSSLYWPAKIDFLPILMSILTTCIFSFAVSASASKRYGRITPVNALRMGESHHSFRKSRMPLEKYNLNLCLHMGLKRFFENIKNNVIVTSIIILLVFTSIIVYTANYNLVTDKTAMRGMVGLEQADIWIYPAPQTDIPKLILDVQKKTEVKDIMRSGNMICLIDGYETILTTAEDYERLVTDVLAEGEYPEEQNEMMISSRSAKAIGKGVGDRAVLDMDGISREYIISGITQSLADEISGISYEAMLQYPGYKSNRIYVYLEEGIQVEAYIRELNKELGDEIVLIDVEKQMDDILQSIGTPFSLLTAAMISITVMIIAFVLFLVLSTLIRKQKKEFGILKAIGYQNKNLILQLFISFLPALSVGAVIGCLLGSTLTNAVLGILFAGLGLVKTYFIIPVLPVVLLSIGVLCAGMSVVYLASMRLKRISPQNLIR